MIHIIYTWLQNYTVDSTTSTDTDTARTRKMRDAKSRALERLRRSGGHDVARQEEAEEAPNLRGDGGGGGPLVAGRLRPARPETGLCSAGRRFHPGNLP